MGTAEIKRRVASHRKKKIKDKDALNVQNCTYNMRLQRKNLSSPIQLNYLAWFSSIIPLC